MAVTGVQLCLGFDTIVELLWVMSIDKRGGFWVDVILTSGTMFGSALGVVKGYPCWQNGSFPVWMFMRGGW